MTLRREAVLSPIAGGGLWRNPVDNPCGQYLWIAGVEEAAGRCAFVCGTLCCPSGEGSPEMPRSRRCPGRGFTGNIAGAGPAMARGCPTSAAHQHRICTESSPDTGSFPPTEGYAASQVVVGPCHPCYPCHLWHLRAPERPGRHRAPHRPPAESGSDARHRKLCVSRETRQDRCR